jgi:hypothetical protein
MTLQEFKAWFDGFTEGFNGKVPTQKQWKRINERVGEINGVSVEHHWHRYQWPYYNTTWTQCASSATPTLAAIGQNAGTGTAMYSLGKAEAEAA